MTNNDPVPPAVTAQLGSRDLFPDLQARVYANHAAISAASAPVTSAATSWLRDQAQRGSVAFGTWMRQRDALREQLARLIGSKASEVGLVSNTMHGVNAVAFGLRWQRGDRVVVLDGEYPTNVVPWLRAAETFDLRPITVPVSDFMGAAPRWDALEAALEQRPRVIAVSAVQFQSGLRMPLREISARCHAVGTQLFVDGVQACGAVPLDVEHDGIDYLACGSHKWLMGIEGSGFLYVRDACMESLRSALTGAMSHQGALDLLIAGPGHLRYDRPLRRDARVFEGGMLAGVTCAALGAAVELIESIGVDPIFNHVQRYHDALEPELVQRGFGSLRHPVPIRRSAILSFRPPPSVFVPDLCALLADDGVVCSSPDGLLRIAPHWPNAVTEVPVLVEAIDAAIARLPE